MSEYKKLILFVVVVGIISIAFHKFNGGSICIFYNIYGLPCPTCGMTRAYYSFLKFNFKGAFEYHPLFWLVPFLFIFYKKKKILYLTTGLFIFVWVIRICFYFPDKEPLNFNNNALFPRIYKLLKKR